MINRALKQIRATTLEHLKDKIKEYEKIPKWEHDFDKKFHLLDDMDQERDLQGEVKKFIRKLLKKQPPIKAVE